MLKPSVMRKAERAMERMYKDTMTVTGYEVALNDDGSTNPNKPVEKGDGVPCKISFKTLDTPDVASIDRDQTKVMIKVFCAMSVPVSKGDRIIAKLLHPVTGRVMETHEGIAGLPAKFLYHQEIELLQDGQA